MLSVVKNCNIDRKTSQTFLGLKFSDVFILLINDKMPTWHFHIMSKKNFMLSVVEHEKSFITLWIASFLISPQNHVVERGGCYSCTTMFHEKNSRTAVNVLKFRTLFSVYK